MKVKVKLTERRVDGMMKFEREDLDKSNHMRYIWFSPYEIANKIEVGSEVILEWCKGTGGVIGGHWAGWRIAA